jgi:RNA polymerase sigma-70 factor (ECF subfamily)
VRYTATLRVLFPGRKIITLHNGDNPKPGSWEELNQFSDERLASELLTGRHDALVVLFDRYHKLVFGVALKIVGDPGEAEDVVQTVFLDVFRALANFDQQRGTLRVWLLQHAYGRSLNRKRHLAAHHFYNSVSLEAGVVEPLSSLKSADIAEASLLMEELLASVSPRRRTVIELTYFEGLTADEISDRLGLPVGIVRHELYRGLAKLRQSVKKRRDPVKEECKIQRKEMLTRDAQAL